MLCGWCTSGVETALVPFVVQGVKMPFLNCFFQGEDDMKLSGAQLVKVQVLSQRQ
jgi:hypothetical protein